MFSLGAITKKVSDHYRSQCRCPELSQVNCLVVSLPKRNNIDKIMRKTSGDEHTDENTEVLRWL